MPNPMIEELREKVKAAQTIEEIEKYGKELEALKEAENTGQVNSNFDPRKAYAAAPINARSTELRREESYKTRMGLDAQQPLNLGLYVRGLYTGKWEGAEAERRALTTSGTGVLIPAVLSAEIIDKARNKSLFMAAGAPVVPMASNNLTYARVKSDPVFAFKAEGAEAAEAAFELDAVQLKAKTIYGYAYVSLEAIESAQNLNEIVTNAFANAMAVAIDKGLLYGQAGAEFAPVGIMNDPDINSITATAGAGYDTFLKAAAAIRRNNGEPSTMAYNASTAELLSLLKDTSGKYLTEPEALQALNHVVTNQLNHSDEGDDALLFDPNAVIIGVQNDIRVRMVTDSEECIKRGLVGFQIYSMVDGKTVQPKHIAKINGIK